MPRLTSLTTPFLLRMREAVPQRVAPMTALSPADANRFDQAGYLTLPGFCNEHELQHLRQTLAMLFARQVGHAEGRQFDMLGLDMDATQMTQPQILNPSVFLPALLETEHFRKVAATARQLLGPHARFSFDHSILKPAGSSAATPWHQDEAHHKHRLLRYRQISFWMPLQDTPRESGCMRYLPRSHLGPLLPHRALRDDPRLHALECDPDYVDESQAIDQPVAAGTCILHDGRTLHAALPNTSTANRMAYIIAFVGPPLPRNASAGTPRSKHEGRTANQARRHRWLVRGGLLTVALRKLRAGPRIQLGVLWLRLRLLARMIWGRESRGE